MLRNSSFIKSMQFVSNTILNGKDFASTGVYIFATIQHERHLILGYNPKHQNLSPFGVIEQKGNDSRNSHMRTRRRDTWDPPHISNEPIISCQDHSKGQQLLISCGIPFINLSEVNALFTQKWKLETHKDYKENDKLVAIPVSTLFRVLNGLFLIIHLKLQHLQSNISRWQNDHLPRHRYLHD